MFFGTGSTKITVDWEKDGVVIPWKKEFEGVCQQVERLYRETESEGVKRNMGRYMTSRECRSCGGKRLKPEYLAVTLQGDNEEAGIDQFCRWSIAKATDWLEELVIVGERKDAMAGVVTELRKLSHSSKWVWVTGLDGASGTFRRRVSTGSVGNAIGCRVVGCYLCFDEPASARRTVFDYGTLKLRDCGNTVVVVEHDEAMVRAADEVVEIGPGAGGHGGELVAQGTAEELARMETATGRWLGREIEKINGRHRKSAFELRILKPEEHNLKGEDVVIPLGQLVGITGPSGSGKSTLVNIILRRALVRQFHRGKDEPGKHAGLEGTEYLDKVVVVDQGALGKSPRSNPATYSGALI